VGMESSIFAEKNIYLEEVQMVEMAVEAGM
jgi:hypothetical protein